MLSLGSAAFDDCHAHRVGCFAMRDIIAIAWSFSEFVVCWRPRLTLSLDLFTTLRTEVAIDIVGRALGLGREDPLGFGGYPAPIEGLATDRAVHVRVHHWPIAMIPLQAIARRDLFLFEPSAPVNCSASSGSCPSLGPPAGTVVPHLGEISSGGTV